METFLIKALQLIVALAFLVIIHEFGHFIFARIFGIKVEKFYMFFDPYFSLFKWKPKQKPNADPNKSSWRDTEYGIGWIPLGGYCKIAGMIDESMDTEQMKQEPKPWEFRTKPAWQRLLVMLGGVMFNFILAILIYAGIAMHWGSQYIPFDAATEGFDFTPAAQKVGFRNGDIPYMADDQLLDASKGDYPYLMADAKVVKVIRNHKDTVSINIPDDFLFRLNDDKGFLAYRLPVYIDRIVPGEAAAKSGLKEGDHIVAIDTIATPAFTELTAALLQYAGKPVPVTVEREGKTLRMTVTPNEHGKLGFQLKPITAVYEPVTIDYNFFESFPKGWEIGTTTLTNYVSSMKHVFSQEGAESLGGFGAIGNMFPERWNWLSFWEITAFLSVALAFMNIIPIPALDGGYTLFLLIEMITRRKPSERFIEVANMIGMGFLFLLLIYANLNDVYRLVLK
ncbi:RIP metalloprotease RseP [uncultured Duncaniella sp.]|uniref:RIP metalloprotease RseP n=1 Tax=uncultured Duncaniella sp. TaxID=2768039 RepID=UPI002601E36E|nr:RIP metalloprotease RseP [uncultured Duncaniella sp.]